MPLPCFLNDLYETLIKQAILLIYYADAISMLEDNCKGWNVCFEVVSVHIGLQEVNKKFVIN